MRPRLVRQAGREKMSGKAGASANFALFNAGESAREWIGAILMFDPVPIRKYIQTQQMELWLSAKWKGNWVDGWNLLLFLLTVLTWQPNHIQTHITVELSAKRRLFCSVS